MFQLRLFHRESYDYKEIFSQHIAELRSLKSHDKLLSTALASLADVFAVRSACVLLKETVDNSYGLKSHLGAAPVHLKLFPRSPLIRWFQNRDEPLGIDELKQDRFERQRDSLMKDFVALKAAAVIPLRIDQQLLGLIGIGAPGGRRRYNREERQLLSLFGFEIAIAIQNSYLYDEVLQQNAKLKEVAVLKNTFIANITHELSTPLHNIIGLSQAVADGADGAVTEEQRQHLSMISQAGEQLLKIHRAILDLAQLESCPEQLNVKKVNIKRLVEGLMPWLTEEVADKQTVVSNEIVGRIPAVYGDEEKIRQVFEKIMENAARFTPQGEIRIQAAPSGDMLKVLISDTGTGIDPAYHTDIFDTFRQVDGGYSREFGGVGLGLAVAKKIVEIHGGRLWLESTPGKGSRFYFTLPLRPAGIRALALR